MIQKKIAILGAFAVGKTSLTDRFVRSIFSERYKTTVGVHIQKKTVRAGGQDVMLVIWDLAGEDEFLEVRTSYLRGSAGYLLVADGTRRDTLDTAIRLQRKAQETLGDAPFALILNKTDRSSEWAVDEHVIRSLADRGWTVFQTSAKQDIGVQQSFELLAARLIEIHELRS
ncbi:MAG: Rab family GTPase [Acidobacteriota bacterium]